MPDLKDVTGFGLIVFVLKCALCIILGRIVEFYYFSRGSTHAHDGLGFKNCKHMQFERETGLKLVSQKNKVFGKMRDEGDVFLY